MPKRPGGVEQLRNQVRERVDRTSVRAVAAEIGMSPSGLHVFLSGSRPHPGTLRKLTKWAEDARSGMQATFDRRDLDAAISLLEQYVNAAPTEKERISRLHWIGSRLKG